MIHFDQLTKRLGKLKAGELLLLKVDGMLSPGKDRDGNAIPPAIRNGTLVRVLETDVDGVKVATQDGKELEFVHSTGARKLDIALGEDGRPLTAWPKAADPEAKTEK